MTDARPMHRLEIEFAPSEGAVIRLIGLVERRGYEVLGVELPAMRADAPARIGLTVRPRDGGRRMAVLAAQVRKVYGVSDVRETALGAANDPSADGHPFETNTLEAAS